MQEAQGNYTDSPVLLLLSVSVISTTAKVY
jgi:hypothetical protein